MTTLKHFHWFWAWEDEKKEAWLREQAQKGWHFKSVSLPGNYIFEQGEPKDYVYRLDYFTEHKDKVNYLQLFQDAGREYMGEMSVWQYFRKESVNGEAPEIYSDNETKSRKYQRILLFLVILMPAFVVNLNNLNRQSGTFYEVVTFMMFCFLIFFCYAIIRLGLRINQLKKRV